VAETVDSYRYISRSTKRIMQAWVKREPARDIPWTEFSRPLPECTVALISSAAVAMHSDEPFDEEGERQNPWWGDPSFRVIPQQATEKDVGYYHLHVNASYAEEDINSVLPLRRLEELQANGEIGRCAPSHYSIMGYILEPNELLQETAPQIIKGLNREKVDVVVLIPV
jgi:D-proline reductase (dithiol) PrdB